MRGAAGTCHPQAAYGNSGEHAEVLCRRSLIGFRRFLGRRGRRFELAWRRLVHPDFDLRLPGRCPGVCSHLSKSSRCSHFAGPLGTRMGSLGSIFKELVGLFVDDGYLALAVVIWVGLMWLLAGHLEHVRGSGLILFLGLSGLLIESARRRARH